MELKNSISENISIFKNMFANDKTVTFREFRGQGFSNLNYCVIFVDNMVDKGIINESIINPLMRSTIYNTGEPYKTLDIILNEVLTSGSIGKSSDLNELIGLLLSGKTLILIDGTNNVLYSDTMKYKTREVTLPESEQVVRGPREAFTESLGVNLSLIRRRIKSPDLKFIFREMGYVTKTNICLCYIENIVSVNILNEVIRRLDGMNVDGVMDSGLIQESIKDAQLSPFKTIGNTERPDVVAANLLEGRIALICDGSPFVLTMPFVFIEYFQVNEDYYDNYLYSSVNRILRLTGFLITTSTPAIYVSLANYHQELLPTPLILSIAASRRGIPLPTILEALLLLFFFEILREAGARLPKTIGQTIAIVGGLVIGQSAVQARLISAPMVIIVAVTGVSSFLIPRLKGPTIIIRLCFLILSAILGLYGYILGVIAILMHLFRIKSFGIPYMLNFGSLKLENNKDMAVRGPWSVTKTHFLTQNQLKNTQKNSNK